jgi:cyclic beta-1,2-glucan synthetase
VRAFADDGREFAYTDTLTHAWPVLSDAVGPELGREVVEAGLRRLERDHLVLLLAPPFTEASDPSPGRIVDYPPGVRENGGQYSHGSSWLIDALARLADLAAADGRPEDAASLRRRALEVWLKISPVGKHTPERLALYGLPPHQQPPDVSYGPGYEGRGGWAWYTGSAARMLSAAYAIVGVGVEGGRLVVAPDATAPDRPLRLRRLTYRGREIVGPAPNTDQAAEPGPPA